MKIQCVVSGDYALVPVESSIYNLKKATEPGLCVDVDIDTERQRSTVQLAKYWADLEELADNTSETSARMLLNNLIEEISIRGFSAAFFHALLKECHGIDSINLMVSSKKTSAYFDFAFPLIEKMKGAFYDLHD